MGFLRTFTWNRVMVTVEDPQVKGFFLFAGQGGSGIETSPAIVLFAADLIVGGRIDEISDGECFSPGLF